MTKVLGHCRRCAFPSTPSRSPPQMLRFKSILQTHTEFLERASPFWVLQGINRWTRHSLSFQDGQGLDTKGSAVSANTKGAS